MKSVFRTDTKKYYNTKAVPDWFWSLKNSGILVIG